MIHSCRQRCRDASSERLAPFVASAPFNMAQAERVIITVLCVPEGVLGHNPDKILRGYIVPDLPSTYVLQFVEIEVTCCMVILSDTPHAMHSIGLSLEDPASVGVPWAATSFWPCRCLGVGIVKGTVARSFNHNFVPHQVSFQLEDLALSHFVELQDSFQIFLPV